MHRAHSLADLVAEADAARLRGDGPRAARILEDILEIDADSWEAHCALARVRLPGAPYTEILAHIHAARRPRVYLEIGVADGTSLALAHPDCRRIGIDPDPVLANPVPGAAIFRATSDSFFVEDVGTALGGQPIDLGFIDGLHLFENVLSDFSNLERHCARDATILIHDCLPLNAAVAARERRTRFWLGDVWRILPALARFRPDLAIAVVAAPPSGLAVVRNLDPDSTVLSALRKDVLAYGSALDFDGAPSLEQLGIARIPSHWSAVARLWQDG